MIDFIKMLVEEWYIFTFFFGWIGGFGLSSWLHER